MIRLTMLGTPDLTIGGSSARDNAMRRPKQALVLAFLATARPRGFHRRARLLALLWPELDETRGRQALRQVLYLLRRAVGREAIVSRGEEELALDDEIVVMDVREFEADIAAGRLEQALTRYHGDFLAGVQSPDSSVELEEWIEGERRHYRQLAASTAWSLVERQEAAGRFSESVHWAEQAVGLLPLDEGGVRRLISLQLRGGDPGAALRTASEYGHRLTALELEPSPSFRELVEQVETRRDATTIPIEPPPGPAAGAVPVLGPEAPLVATVTPGRRARRWGWWTAGGLIAAALVTASLLGRSPWPATQLFAVGEFQDLSQPDSVLPIPVVSDLLATSLARLPGLEVLSGARLVELRSQLGASRADPAAPLAAARAGGATTLVEGTMVTTGGARSLRLHLLDIRTGRIRSSFTVEGRDLFDVVDRATAAMAEQNGVAPPDQPASDVTSRSLIAYRFYEEGLRAFFQGDNSAARRLFDAALAEDSTFALAAYYDGLASSSDAEHSRMLDRANRLAAHVSERERLLIRATWLLERQEPTAIAVAESLQDRYPSDPNGFRIRGTLLLTRGDFAGAVGQLRQAIAMDSLSLKGRAPRCTACDAYQSLAVTYQQWDSLTASARVAREWIAQRPADLGAWATLLSSQEWRGDPDILQVMREGETRFGRAFETRLLPSILAIRAGRHDEAEQRLRGMIVEGDSALRGDATWYLAICLRDQGRPVAAAALPLLDPGLRGVLELESGQFRAAVRRFATLATKIDPRSPGHSARNRTWGLTHLATAYSALGDTSRLGPLADSMEQSGLRSLYGRDNRLHHYVRGLLRRARGDRVGAVGEFRAAIYSWNAGYTRINLELGRTLLELHQPEEAIRVLRPALRGSIESSNLYVTRTELHEALAQAFVAARQLDSARVHYEWVERAWRTAEPEFAARHAEARRNLAMAGVGP